MPFFKRADDALVAIVDRAREATARTGDAWINVSESEFPALSGMIERRVPQITTALQDGGIEVLQADVESWARLVRLHVRLQ